MGLDLRMPNINGATEKEMLSQIRSYLYQFIPQLQWALNNMEASSSTSQAAQQIIKEKVVTSTAAASPAATFNDIKSLIIKSADIVNAYYDEISSRLEGLYVAESDFGTFVEKTEQSIEGTSTYVEQKFSNVQAIIYDEVAALNGTLDQKVGDLNSAIKGANDGIEALNATIIEANAHIRSGILYYSSGTPVYGLEIGQRNLVGGEEVFNKYARFTADRLSFYDQNGTEAAYISDQKLYIHNMEVTSSYKIGGFVDTVTADGGIVTKWVGGNG